MTLDYDLAAILTPENVALLRRALVLTVSASGLAWTAGMLLAIGLLLLRLSGRPVAIALVKAFVSYHRNVPVLVQLMLWYFGISTLLPPGLRQDINQAGGELLFTVIALSLYISAYFCEDLRSGLRAIPASQQEAARALGLGFMGAMRHVILPQCVRNALPALVNNTVVLFKASSLGSVVGLAELTYVSRQIENATFRSFEAYSLVTVVYLVCCLLLMFCGAAIAWHFRKEAR